MKEIVFLLFAMFSGGYLIYKLARRGISKKYERKVQSPWSALNDGVDPTL
ncbi:MAG: hypothetical protein HQ476_03595 [SAR202 cluster bacterium]|jgi:hypothetical protein|nr:hypothetical protein [SAR202 cluster bacterium]|tara:strand:- start:36206 stop:36355 length:150 start_codon:yes stop_codon:yes gene_type:complete